MYIHDRQSTGFRYRRNENHSTLWRAGGKLRGHPGTSPPARPLISSFEGRTFSSIGQIPAELCNLPIEREQLQCINAAERWELYQKGDGSYDRARAAGKFSGPRWKYYIHPQELKQRYGPFPNIRLQRPHLHASAVQVDKEYQKVKFFRSYYFDLNKAASEASLSLDRSERLQIQPERESFVKLLSQAFIDSVTGDVRDRLVKAIIDEVVAKYLGVLDILLTLKDIYDRVQAKRLVNEQYSKRRDEAFKRKLSFFMDLKAAALARQYRKDRVSVRNWLSLQYWRFDEINREWVKYSYIEETLSKGLDPDRPQPPSFRPAR